MGDLSYREGVVGVGGDVAQSAGTIGGEAADAGYRAASAAAAGKKSEATVEIGITGWNTGLRNGVTNRQGSGIDFDHASTRAINDVIGIAVGQTIGDKGEGATAKGWTINRVGLEIAAGERSGAQER